MDEKKKVAITGVGGFVGSALARALVSTGVQVIGVARGNYPELIELGVDLHRIDIGSDDAPPRLKEAFRGVEVVFHTASKVDMWGSAEEFERTNVQGTTSCLQASRESGVRCFVYTSSPSVIADGKDLRGIDENYPYPSKYLAHYPRTKAIAEKEVLKSNCEQLYTCSLRPHLIWGPGDHHLIPTIVERAKLERLIQVGEGKNKIDTCFIEDCVKAHILAWKALLERPESRGEAYFISQGEPVNMWKWIEEILDYHQIPKVKRRISASLAYMIAAVLEGIAKFTRKEPLLTRFLVHEMATDHYFDLRKSKEMLGYSPKYSIKEAMDLTFSELALENMQRA